MMTRVTLRNLAAHKIRLLLTGISVILGVAFVAGTLIFTDTMTKQFDDLFGGIAKGVAVDVRAKPVTTQPGDDGMSGEPVPAALVEQLKKIDGVKDPVGNVLGYTAVVGRDGKAIGGQGPPQMGMNWIGDLGDYTLVQGRAPSGEREVALDRETAKKAGYGVGDTAKIIVSSGAPRQMTVTGVLDVGEMMGSTIAVFDTATAQRLLLKPGFFSDIQMGSQGVDEKTLRDRVAAQLPNGLEAVTGEQVREDAKSDVASIMDFFRIFLLVFALISIFVGAFIIYNTFSMLVAQRSRELALLRAIGAARPQVTRAVLGEAVAVGIVGSTFGFALGAGLAAVLQSTVGTGTGGLVFTVQTVLVSYAVGILVTVASAYFPARRAAKTPPVAAMRDDVALPQRSMRIRLALGTLLALLGAASITLGLVGDLGGTAAGTTVGLGALLVFLGVTMLAPVISIPVVRVLGWPAARLLRTPGRLARQNALRNPRRTAATASALMIGLALITTVNVIGASMRASVDQQIDEQFGADFMVTSTAMTGGVPLDAAEKISKVPGVTSAAPYYAGNGVIDGKQAAYVAGDAAALGKAAKLEMRSGDADPGTNGILLDQDTAKARGVGVGGTVPMKFADGRTENLRVTGVYAKNDMIGPRFVAEDVHLAHTARPRAMLLMVDAGGSTTAKAGIEAAVADNPTLEVQDQAAMKDQAREQIDMFVTGLTMLLIMSVIIAAVGVVNTLALSVIERTREIGLLRAIGMGRRQLRRMIRAESIVIAVFGALLGMSIGVLFGTALQQALSDQGLAVLSIPFGTLIVYLVIAAIIGVLAALWPAWRAGRMDVLKAIATE
ncbi:ABC transporter permease [Actinomadura flavalba]|uniref:ABC transporter permease n=1 Tax=Actinomadura flavalba TaxID=1120938 RepID=UPI00039B6B64|nr:FtsX-like permease family protein [Actinomadura flavalba]